METNNLPQAISLVAEQLRKCEDYHYSWQANIAMAFKDEFDRSVSEKGKKWAISHIHEISNKAAENFLNILMRS